MGTKRCQYCAEEVQKAAKVCIHCGNPTSKPLISKGMIKFLIIWFAFCFFYYYLAGPGAEVKTFGN